MASKFLLSGFALLRGGDFDYQTGLKSRGARVDSAFFVLHPGYTQEEQILKRPLIIQIEAGHAIKRVGGVLGCGFILEQPGLHRQCTAVTPMGCRHFLDHAELHAVSGLEPFKVFIHDSLETFQRFILQNILAGKEAVGDLPLRTQCTKLLLPLPTQNSEEAEARLNAT